MVGWPHQRSHQRYWPVLFSLGLLSDVEAKFSRFSLFQSINGVISIRLQTQQWSWTGWRISGQVIFCWTFALAQAVVCMNQRSRQREIDSLPFCFFYNLEHQDCYWQMTRSRVWSHVTKRYVSPSASLMVLRFLRCSKSPLVWYILPSHFLQDQNHSQSCLTEIAHRPKYMRVYSDWITTWLRNNYWNVFHLWHSSWK